MKVHRFAKGFACESNCEAANTLTLIDATALHQAQEFVRALQSTGYISSTGQAYLAEPNLSRFGMARKTREKARLPSWKKYGVDPRFKRY